MSSHSPLRGWSPIPEDRNAAPWYRQPWPWVLIALPLTSVVAGFTTLYIAMQDPDGLVQDDYYDAGVAIQARLDRQRLAERMGLEGGLVVPTAGGEVSFDFGGNVPAGSEELSLALRHATRAQYDVDLTLSAYGGGRYIAVLEEPLAPGHWNITLDPPDHAWRISGRGFVAMDADAPLTVELSP